MPAFNTVIRPIRPRAAHSPIRPEHFRYLGLQAETMIERRSARGLTTSELRFLAEDCRAQARRFAGATA